MKKKYQLIFSIILLIFAIWALLYGEPYWTAIGLDPILVNIIILNIFVYIGKTIASRLTRFFVKITLIRFTIIIVINIIWFSFIMSLIYAISLPLGAAITSFLVLAIALTFKDRINNVVAGIMILSSKSFEIGDFIETNGIEGIVREITLNYTKIRKMDGNISNIPNANIFNASVKRFTAKKDIEIQKESDESFQIRGYVDKLGKIISKGEKITRYIKSVQILATMDPNKLEDILDQIFTEYEAIFNFKPYYYVNFTFKTRCSITLQIVADNPSKIPLYFNSFLRDVLFHLYSNDIYEDWTGDRSLIVDISEEEV